MGTQGSKRIMKKSDKIINKQFYNCDFPGGLSSERSQYKIENLMSKITYGGGQYQFL